MPNPDPYSVPLQDIDMSVPELYQHNLDWAYFARLRKEDPVHYCAESTFGPYWSVTKFDDIMYVERNHEPPAAILVGRHDAERRPRRCGADR